MFNTLNYKTILTYIIFVIFLVPSMIKAENAPLFNIPNANKVDSWESVGVDGFSGGEVSNAKIAVDNYGTPYVAYTDVANGSKATVKKFDGTNWVTVGAVGFSANFTAGEIFMRDITINRDRPCVLYNSIVNIFDGTNWISSGDINDMVSNTATIVDYRDVLYVDIGTNVKKHMGSGWSLLGGFHDRDASGDISMAFDSHGTIFIAYQARYFVKIKKLPGLASNWVDMPNIGFGVDGSIVIDSNNTPFAVFGDRTVDAKATVKKFDGTNWIVVGSAGFSDARISDAWLVLDAHDTPFVVYVDTANASKATVKKFDGTNWVTVSSLAISTGASSYGYSKQYTFSSLSRYSKCK